MVNETQKKAFIDGYITGFTDGEGSFNCSWRKRDDFLIGWKITPVFNISQKEEWVLRCIQQHLGCGTIRFRKDGVWVYEVEKKKDLLFQIVPFFRRNKFLSKKKRKDFIRFLRALHILYKRNKNKTLSDIHFLVELFSQVETKRSRKYTNSEIISRATQFWGKNAEKIAEKNSQFKHLIE